MENQGIERLHGGGVSENRSEQGFPDKTPSRPSPINKGRSKTDKNFSSYGGRPPRRWRERRGGFIEKICNKVISPHLASATHCSASRVTRLTTYRRFPLLPIGEERAKAAFTLAEVLITLGIIGVVAAVTLPALIQNYQKKTYVEGLKVAYTTLNQAMKQAMATDGVERFQDTTLFKTCEWSNMTAGLTYAGDGKFDGSDLGIKACENELSKYLKKVEYIPLTAVRAGYDGDSAVTLTGASCSKDIMGKFATFSLNDRNSCNLINNGTFLIMNSMVMQTVFIDHSYYFGDIYIDVNGQNGPNTYGRDTFKFVVLENGAVEPWYSIQRAKASAKDSNSPLSEKTYYGNPSMSVEALDAKYCNPKGCSSEVSACGKNCAAKIMYENWQMNY